MPDVVRAVDIDCQERKTKVEIRNKSSKKLLDVTMNSYCWIARGAARAMRHQICFMQPFARDVL